MYKDIQCHVIEAVEEDYPVAGTDIERGPKAFLHPRVPVALDGEALGVQLPSAGAEVVRRSTGLSESSASVVCRSIGPLCSDIGDFGLADSEGK